MNINKDLFWIMKKKRKKKKESHDPALSPHRRRFLQLAHFVALCIFSKDCLLPCRISVQRMASLLLFVGGRRDYFVCPFFHHLDDLLMRWLGSHWAKESRLTRRGYNSKIILVWLYALDQWNSPCQSRGPLELSRHRHGHEGWESSRRFATEQ